MCLFKLIPLLKPIPVLKPISLLKPIPVLKPIPLFTRSDIRNKNLLMETGSWQIYETGMNTEKAGRHLEQMPAQLLI